LCYSCATKHIYNLNCSEHDETEKKHKLFHVLAFLHYWELSLVEIIPQFEGYDV